MRGMLWIRSRCGTIIFAPHNIELSDDLIERIKADGSEITVFSCSILEEIGSSLMEFKPGPDAAVNLVRSLGATYFYATHDMGDAFDSGLIWDIIVRYWMPQNQFRDLVGQGLYRASQNNVSAWPRSDVLGLSLVPPGLGTEGIPHGSVAPGTVWLYQYLGFAVILLLIVVVMACTIKHPQFQDYVWYFVASLSAVTTTVFAIAALMTMSDNFNHNIL